MKDTVSALILFTVLIFAASFSFSQSKLMTEKERGLYRSNKVKSVTIDYGSGQKTVIKYDMDGKPTGENDFYNGQEANITHYKYNSYGNLIEMAYLGYESGDYMVTLYEYDSDGNVIKTKEGSYESEAPANGDYNEYSYDENGNLLTQTYYWFEEAGLKSGPVKYNNIYDNGNLMSSEADCSPGNTEAEYIEYTYNDNHQLKIKKVYSKDCNSEKLTNTELIKFEYLDNGLIHKTYFTGSYNSGMTASVYKYEFYK